MKNCCDILLLTRKCLKLGLVVVCLLLAIGAKTTMAHVEHHDGVTYNVVYLNTGGNSNGNSREHPVGTWADAFKELNKDDGWNHNIIVVTGTMHLNFKEGDTKDKHGRSGTKATITGVWPWDADGNATTDQIKNGGQAMLFGNTNNVNNNNNIGTDIRFRNLRIQGDGTEQNRLSLRLHNVLFDEGLVMMGFAQLSTQYGMISGRKAPALHIQLSFDHFGQNRATDAVYEMPNNEKMTVEFRSGHYGRVALSRTQGTSEALVRSCYIQGTPEKPIMAKVVMNIQPGNDNTGGYADDIGILLGGSSQGIVCADVEFDLLKGKIGTMVAGTQGVNVNACLSMGAPKIPMATFAGRTKVVVGHEGGSNSDVTIQTYYGGTQGRTLNTQNTSCLAWSFFYGESEFDMYSGTIEQDVFSSATAFSGLRYEDDHNLHTPDFAIPYVNANNVFTFGGYSEAGIMATIKSTFNGNVDLSETKITINIHGGLVKGSVYGGSRGWVSEVPSNRAPNGCGTHYGNTYVNIDGGTIQGSVYGGGMGTTNYGLNDVAQVYGNTYVMIMGGEIRGDVYGGGGGVASGDGQIAKLKGDPTVKVMTEDGKSAHILGSVYGGGKASKVEGSPTVRIKGGEGDGKKVTIDNHVFGGGLGNTAVVTGSTEVGINGNTHVGMNVYGGGSVGGNTHVVIGDWD